MRLHEKRSAKLRSAGECSACTAVIGCGAIDGLDLNSYLAAQPFAGCVGLAHVLHGTTAESRADPATFLRINVTFAAHAAPPHRHWPPGVARTCSETESRLNSANLPRFKQLQAGGRRSTACSTPQKGCNTLLQRQRKGHACVQPPQPSCRGRMTKLHCKAACNRQASNWHVRREVPIHIAMAWQDHTAQRPYHLPALQTGRYAARCLRRQKMSPSAVSGIMTSLLLPSRQ